MVITNLTAQIKNPDRVNVFVDNRFRFSLDVSQVVDLGVKIGLELSDEDLAKLEAEGQFGKLYAQALNYSFTRPRSVREIKDYLHKKSQPKISKTGKKIAGLPTDLSDRVVVRLKEKGYLNDEKFAEWWVENRFLKKGVSRLRLRQDLAKKGVPREIVDRVLEQSNRNDNDELARVIAKKSSRYSDPQKLMIYLARQGFSYDDIKSALQNSDEEASS